MRSEDVHFILTNDDAAALVLSWARVGAVPNMSEDELVRTWSRVSGVSLFETRRLAPVLLGAAICKPPDEVDPMALSVAANLVAVRLDGLAARVARAQRRRREAEEERQASPTPAPPATSPSADSPKPRRRRPA